MNASVAALQSCLEQETSQMKAFLQLLQEEAKALEDGATDNALAATTAHKNELADALTELAIQRNDLLKALGFESDGPGLSAAVAAHPSLAPMRQQLLEITAEARSQNEANGRIIEVFLEHNQRALETLRRLAGIGDLYDASGRTRPGNKTATRNIKVG